MCSHPASVCYRAQRLSLVDRLTRPTPGGHMAASHWLERGVGVGGEGNSYLCDFCVRFFAREGSRSSGRYVPLILAGGLWGWILITRSWGRYAPLLLAPAEGWGPFGWKEDLHIDLDMVEIFGVYIMGWCPGYLWLFLNWGWPRLQCLTTEILPHQPGNNKPIN